MEAWIQLVSGVGFPIAMCLWFMFKTEKSLEQVATVINNNTIALHRVEAVLDSRLG